jgi:polyvinyl alcohol dehydrogenase (cytochrome)
MTRSLACLATLSLATAMQCQDGAAIYKSKCASCHESAATHAPSRAALKQMYPESVLQTMEIGSMKPFAASLSADERRAVALFITGKTFGNAPDLNSKAGYCAAESGDFSDPLGTPGWNGWSPDLTNTRFQPASGIRPEDVPKLKLRWAFGIPNATITNGAVSAVAGRVFFGAPNSTVYSLDAKTGCIYWTYKSNAAVRSALTIGNTAKSSRYAAFFGDGLAYVYAVDAANGSLLWKTKVEDFPGSRITGTPKLYGERLYVPISIIEEGLAIDPKYECCRSRPSVVALNASTGKEIWRRHMIEGELKRTGKNRIGTQLWGPAGASIWSSLTIDAEKNVLYVGTGNNFSNPTTNTSDAVIALRMDNGELLWSRQITAGDAYNVACVRPDTTNCPDHPGPDYDFGSSPILVKLPNGKRALLAGQKSGVMTALDPDNNGEILWQTRVGKGGLLGGIQWGSAVERDRVYVPLSDIAWLGERLLDPSKGGGLFALSATTGEKLWVTPAPSCQGRKNCSPAQSAAAAAMPGVVFTGSVDGHVRGYSTRNGTIIWDFDTARDYQTVNKVPARGGSMDGPGPAIAGGALYIPSGYGIWGGLPGSVVLAFSVDGI